MVLHNSELPKHFRYMSTVILARGHCHRPLPQPESPNYDYSHSYTILTLVIIYYTTRRPNH